MSPLESTAAVGAPGVGFALALNHGSANQVRRWIRAGWRSPYTSTPSPGGVRRNTSGGASFRTDGEWVALGPLRPLTVIEGSTTSSSPMRWLA